MQIAQQTIVMYLIIYKPKAKKTNKNKNRKKEKSLKAT